MIPGLVCRGSYWKPEVQRHGGPDCQACVPRRTFPTISKQVDPPALSHHSFPTRTDFNTKVRQKVSTLFLFYYYIIYLEFQKQSTSLFYIFTFLCDAFFPASYQLFICHQQNMFLVERIATDALQHSHHHYMKIFLPLQLLWAVQRSGNQMALNL